MKLSNESTQSVYISPNFLTKQLMPSAFGKAKVALKKNSLVTHAIGLLNKTVSPRYLVF